MDKASLAVEAFFYDSYSNVIRENMTKKTAPEIQFRIDKASAENGNSLAQYALGVAFEQGLLVKQCYVRAVKWYKLAAAQNYVPAQYKLGSLYEGVIGGPDRLSFTDKTEAKYWYREAALQNHAGAISRLSALEKSDDILIQPERTGYEFKVLNIPRESIISQQSRLIKLIAKGKEQGSLTYSEIYDHLLSKFISDPDQIEENIQMFNDMGITIIREDPHSGTVNLNDDNEMVSALDRNPPLVSEDKDIDAKNKVFVVTQDPEVGKKIDHRGDASQENNSPLRIQIRSVKPNEENIPSGEPYRPKYKKTLRVDDVHKTSVTGVNIMPSTKREVSLGKLESRMKEAKNDNFNIREDKLVKEVIDLSSSNNFEPSQENFAEAFEELENNKKMGLWAMVYANTENEEEARKRYINYRAKELSVLEEKENKKEETERNEFILKQIEIMESARILKKIEEGKIELEKLRIRSEKEVERLRIDSEEEKRKLVEEKIEKVKKMKREIKEKELALNAKKDREKLLGQLPKLLLWAKKEISIEIILKNGFYRIRNKSSGEFEEFSNKLELVKKLTNLRRRGQSRKEANKYKKVVARSSTR